MGNNMYEYYFRIPYVWSHYLSKAQEKVLKKTMANLFHHFCHKKRTSIQQICFQFFLWICIWNVIVHIRWHVFIITWRQILFFAISFWFQSLKHHKYFSLLQNIEGLFVFRQKNKIQKQMLTWLLKVFNVVISKSIASKPSFKRYFANKFAFKICP